MQHVRTANDSQRWPLGEWNVLFSEVYGLPMLPGTASHPCHEGSWLNPMSCKAKRQRKWDGDLVAGKEAKRRSRNADDHNILYMCMNCQRVCVHVFIYTRTDPDSQLDLSFMLM